MYLNKNIYNEISSKWKGKVYEYWGRMEPRLQLLDKVMPLLKGMDVLEIGSNAGLFGYEINNYAKSYVGVEASEHYHRQALRTAKFMKGNFKFINQKAIRFLKKTKRKFNAFASFFVLYHLKPKELDLLKSVWKDCFVIINMVRIQNKNLTRNPFRLCKYKNIFKLFKDYDNMLYVEKDENLYMVVSRKHGF